MDISWSSSTILQYFGNLVWRANSLEKKKKLWCWERLRAGGEGSNRGWDGWMAWPTQWTWVWANSRRQWRTGKPGMLQSMRSQRVRYYIVVEQEQRWTQKREGGWDKLKDWNWYIHTTTYKIGNLEGPTVYHRKTYSMLYNDLYGKRISKRVDLHVCINIADLLCYTAEANPTL